MCIRDSVWWGLATAVLQLCIGLGSRVAAWLDKPKMILVASAVLLATTLFVQLFLGITAAMLLALVILCLFFLDTSVTHFLHSKISSEVRSASTSMVSTIGRIVLSGAIVVFAVLNESKNEITGFWILVAMAGIIVLLGILNYKPMARFAPHGSLKTLE